MKVLMTADLFEPDSIEIVLGTREGGATVMWINVNGECSIRAFNIKDVTIDDRRTKKD